MSTFTHVIFVRKTKITKKREIFTEISLLKKFYRTTVIWKLFPLVLIAGTIFYFERKSSTEKNRLKGATLSNVVVKINSNWSGGRSYDYITDNNYTITLLNNDTLQVGDSIVKEANTNSFKVYRKTNGVYSFFKNFNIH